MGNEPQIDEKKAWLTVLAPNLGPMFDEQEDNVWGAPNGGVSLDTVGGTSKATPAPVSPVGAKGTQPAAPPGKVATPQAAGTPDGLVQAPGIWNQTQDDVKAQIGKLKVAIRAAFVGEAPKLVTDIDKKMSKLDDFHAKLDHGLTNSLTKAQTSAEPAARKQAIALARARIKDCVQYVKSQEKFIAYLDSNPFGVALNIKQTLADRLAQVNKDLG
jgi:hypothetical protein